ncbi:uncharacterized protein LOC144709100 [Wolffia australiana]
MVSELHDAASASIDDLRRPLAMPIPPSPPPGGDLQARVPTISTAPAATLKLTKTNYLLWKIQIVLIIKAQGLGKHLTHPMPPEEEDTDDENTSWKHNDQQVLSIIISSLSTELLPVVSGCITAQAAWEKLGTKLSSASESWIMELTSRFHSIKKGSKSLDEYISEFHHLLAEIINAGESKFCSFCTGVTTRNGNLSFDDLLVSLRAEVSLDNFESDDEASETRIAPMENKVQAQHSQQAGSYREENPRNGHRSGNNRGRGGRTRRFIPRCQLCLKQGHRALDCRSLRSQPTSTMAIQPASAF